MSRVQNELRTKFGYRLRKATFRQKSLHTQSLLTRPAYPSSTEQFCENFDRNFDEQRSGRKLKPWFSSTIDRPLITTAPRATLRSLGCFSRRPTVFTPRRNRSQHEGVGAPNQSERPPRVRCPLGFMHFRRHAPRR